MNILLIAKLLDNSLNCILEPLSKLTSVDHIYVLRDTVGSMNSGKITYIDNHYFSPGNKLRHLFKLKRGVEICKRYKIDFIIGVLIYPHGYIGRLISLYTRLPYIHITIAGHREFWLNGKIIERINLLLFRKSHLITVTGSNTRNYLTLKGYNPQKIEILPNVIRMDNYNDLERERSYDIVVLSRFDKNKNISLILKAIAKIDKSLNVQVLIAGHGSEYNNLIFESKSLGIEHNVHFVGWVEESRKKDIYNSARLFVLCSKGEGFPLSLLEAMACGCVPVISNVGDISDVVSNDLNGCIVKDIDNEKELAAILELLIKNPQMINRLSIQAKEVKTKFSFENVEPIWEKILTKKNKVYAADK
jgi:glycosyltransferase involved in cell wall biosynthesis